jgi:hypothetical protein
MPKFKTTLYTLVEFSMEVEAADEESALDVAHDRAREFSAQHLDGHDYTVALNDEWQLQDAEVTEL